MNTTFFAVSFILLSLTVLLLRGANEPRSTRYRQRLLPLLAPLVGVGGLVIYWIYPATMAVINGGVLETGRELLASFELLTGWETRADLAVAEKYPLLLYNLIILLFFLFVKAAYRVFGGFLRLFHSLLAKLPGMQGWPAKMRAIMLFATPFHEGEWGGVYLAASWVFPGRVLRVFSSFYFLCLVIFLFGLACDPQFLREYGFLDLPVVSLLFFLELGWYLKGDPSVDPPVDDEQDAASREQQNLEGLWKEYNTLCPERHLAASRLINYPPVTLQAKASISSGSGGERSELFIDIIEKNLAVNQQQGLSDSQRTAIRLAFSGEDVHLIEPVFTQAAAVVFSVLQRDYLMGGTILVLLPWDIDERGRQEVRRWLERGFATVYFDSFSVAVGEESFDTLSVVMATPSELLCGGEADQWLESLSRVVVVDSARVFFANIFQAEECCTLLEDKCQRSPDYLLLSTTDHRDLEGSLRDFLGVQPREIVLHKNREKLHHAYHIWQVEGEPPFQQRVLRNNRGISYGSVIPLLVPAVQHGLEKIVFYGVKKRLFKENLEEFGQEQELLNITLSDIAAPCFFPPVITSDERGLVIGRDSSCNLVESVKTGLGVCRQQTLLLLVSPLYMLRDYLAESLDYFIQSDALTSYLLSPRKLKTKYTIGMALYGRLKNGFLSEEVIKNRYLHQIPGGENASISVKKRLVDLFYDLFEEDFLQLDLLHEEKYYHYNDQTQPPSYVQLSRFRLSKVVDKRTFITSHRYFSLQDSSGKILGRVHSDQVYQNYLVGQIHGIAGEPYRVEQIDQEVGILRLAHCAGSTISTHRHVRSVLIVPQERYNKYETIRNDIGDGEVSGRIYFGECEFEVRVDGFHSFTGSWENARYTSLQKPVVKRYTFGRFLQMAFTLSEQSTLKGEGVAETLALLLQEIMVTIFPRSYRSLCVTCPGLQDGPARKNGWSGNGTPCGLLPVMEGLEAEQESGSRDFSVYVFEDAEFDMGMIKTISEQWKILFTILDDYLHWLTDENSITSQEQKEKFLCFGADSIHSQLKLSAVRDIVDYLLRNEPDTLRKLKTRAPSS